MQSDQLKEVFNQQSTSYDRAIQKIAPIYDALHFLLEAVFPSYQAKPEFFV